MEYMSTGFIRTLLRSKLLIDDDRILVEDAITDLVLKFPSNQKFSAVLMSSLSILIGSLWWTEQTVWPVLYKTLVGMSVAFIFVVCVGSLPLLLSPLMNYGVRCWNRSDRTVHLFLVGLRRRETYIYGLQQSLQAETTYVCAPQSRLQCIAELRDVIHHCRNLSGTFLEELDLKSADEYANPAILEMANSTQVDIREDQVEIPALKALWQFMFIHRSEALRNLALYHLQTMSKLISTRKYLSAIAAARSTLFKLLKFVMNTTKVSVKMEEFEVNRGNYGEKSKVYDVGAKSVDVEGLERLMTQAEFLLNQLSGLKKLPEDRRFLMKILCEMADTVGKEADVTPSNTCNKGTDCLKSELEDQQGTSINEDSETIKHDFEVFEAEIGQVPNVKVAGEIDHEVDINGPMKVKSLRDELKVALSKRKAAFDKRQVAALARVRNCTVEEVIKQEEVERQMIAETAFQPPERVVYAPQQRLDISSADLLAAMKRRPKIDLLGDIDE